jgi:hypothetical protein
MQKRLDGIPLFLLLLCTACAAGRPEPPTAPPPSAIVVQVGMPAALRPARPALTVCQQALPGVAILAIEVAEAEETPPGFAIHLSLGSAPPESTFSAALAQEQILVVVNEDNPIDELNAGDLADIYQGSRQQWGATGADDRSIEPWAYPRPSGLRSVFEGALGGAQAFPEGLVFLAPDPQAMVEAVAASEAAIGYLPAAWLDEGIVPVPLAPELEEAWKLPVLTYTLEPLDDASRALIACLQSGPGQDTLLESYAPWAP